MRRWRSKALHFNKATWWGSTVVAVVVFRQILFTLSSASQNSPPPPLSWRQLKDPLPAAQQSSFIWVLRSPVSSASLVSLYHPNVSTTSCKSQSQTASQGWESHSLEHHCQLPQQRFTVSFPIAPYACKLIRIKREEWMFCWQRLREFMCRAEIIFKVISSKGYFEKCCVHTQLGVIFSP